MSVTPSVMDVAAAASAGILSPAGDTMLGGGRVPASSHGRRRRRSQEDGDDAGHHKHRKHRKHRRGEDRDNKPDVVAMPHPTAIAAAPMPPVVVAMSPSTAIAEVPMPPTVRLLHASGTATPLGNFTGVSPGPASPTPSVTSAGGTSDADIRHVDSQIVAVAGEGGNPPRGNDAAYYVSEQEMTRSM